MNRPAWRDPLTWVVVVLVTLPVVVAAIAALGRNGALASDMALINLRLRDTGTVDTPLLGPFSRYGWNHPGPLMFWLLAPIYRVLGTDPQAMYAAGAVANAIGLGALVVLARRFGGRRLLAATAVGATLLVAGTGTVMADPWNPYLAMVPFAVFLMAAAATADGDVVMVPVVLGLGSLLVQTHVGYAVLVAAIGIWTLGWLVRRFVHPPADRRRPSRRTAVLVGVISVIVVGAAWVGPVIEQVSNEPGNLTKVVEYFTGNDSEVTGGSVGFGALARQLHPLGPWLGGPERTGTNTILNEASLWWALPAIVGLGVAMGWSWRRRDRRPLMLGGTVAVGIVAATFASTRVTGSAYFYLFRFWWPLAMLLWVTIGWVVLRAVAAVEPTRRLALATAALVVVVGAGTVANSIELSGDLAPLPGAPAVTAVTDTALDRLKPGGTYLVEASGWSFFGELFGVMDRLDAEGFTVVTDPRFVTQFGERRVLGGEDAPSNIDGRLVVATNGSVDYLARQPGYVALASWDPLDASERAETRVLWADIRRRLEGAGYRDLAAEVGNIPLDVLLANTGTLADDVGIPAATRTRLADLEPRGVRVTLFLAPPEDARS